MKKMIAMSLAHIATYNTMHTKEQPNERCKDIHIKILITVYKLRYLQVKVNNSQYYLYS